MTAPSAHRRALGSAPIATGVSANRRTLGSSFDPLRNSLNAIRLVLAGLVIVSHSWLVGGYGPDPEIAGETLGRWAVVGFFVISGFLITRSRLARPARGFYRDRALRILPGYLAALAVCAFVLAPLVAAADPTRHYRLSSALAFFVRDLPLYPPYLAQPGIGDTLAGLPFPDYWIGAAWTLFWEAACYVAVGVAGSVLPRRAAGTAALASFAALVAVDTGHWAGLVRFPGTLAVALWPLMAFATGAAMWCYRDRIPLTWPVLAAASVVLAVVAATGHGVDAAPAALGLLLFKASEVLPLHGLRARHDISYGVYIYGWPAQMLLVVALHEHSAHVPAWMFALVSLGLAAALGALSCLLVEQPALRRKTTARAA